MQNTDLDNRLDRARAALRDRDLIGAIRACEEALELDPQSAIALLLMAAISNELGDPFRALDVLQHAHAHHPHNREVVLLMGGLNAGLGRLSDATYFAKLAMTLTSDPRLAALLPAAMREPEFLMANLKAPDFLMRANLQYELGDMPSALRLAEMAVTNAPEDPAAYTILGRCRMRMGLWDGAVAALTVAAEQAPGDAASRAALAEALVMRGDYGDGRTVLESALGDNPEDVALGSLLVDLAAFDPEATAEKIRGEVRRWNVQFAQTRTDAPALPEGMAERPSVAFLLNQPALDRWLPTIEAAFAELSRRDIDIHVLQQFLNDEKATARLNKYTASWREVANSDDETLAFILEQMGVGMLVDVSGFSHGNRRPVLSRRIVPCQIGWLATGAEYSEGAIDYVLGDQVASDALGDQRLIVLPAGGYAYRPKEPATSPRPPAASCGHVTFGATGVLATALPSVPLWAAVLQAVPDAVLLLGNVPDMDNGSMQRLFAAFNRFGLSDRVLLHRPDGPAAFDFLKEIDILLDSLVVSGRLELCEALQEGIPVVTLCGKTSESTRGASIVTAAGRPEWATATPDTFVAVAAGLAGDLDALAALRTDLRVQLPHSPLCDARATAAAMELVFRRLGKTRQE